jgi:hypothetical protein
MKRFLLLAFTLPAFLVLQGCSVVTTLENLIQATSDALPILEGLGVQVPASVVIYVTDAAQCEALQNGSTQPTGAQLAAISACLAADIAPTLGGGVASAIVAIVAQIAKDIEIYEQQNPPTSSAPVAAQRVAKNLSASDAKRLAALELKAVQIVREYARVFPTAHDWLARQH